MERNKEREENFPQPHLPCYSAPTHEETLVFSLCQRSLKFRSKSNEWIKCRESERTNIRVPLYIAFCSGLGRQHAEGADGSRYQSIYEPTEPSQPMMSNDVSEDRLQHRERKIHFGFFWPEYLGLPSIRLPKFAFPSVTNQFTALLLLCKEFGKEIKIVRVRLPLVDLLARFDGKFLGYSHIWSTPYVINAILGHYAGFWIFWRESFKARGSRLGPAGRKIASLEDHTIRTNSVFLRRQQK